MTLTDLWLPIGRHAQDLLDHSDEMVNETSERGVKLGLILVDNAIEILLREYLRYHKRISQRKIEDFRFHELLQQSRDLDIVSKREGNFLFIHDTRNLLYHNGSLMPSEDDVRSAISFGKQLFNELHPNHKLLVIGYTLPNIKTIKKVREKLNAIYITEIYFVTLFETMLKSKGYTINLHYDRPGFGYDMMATKQNETILIEFKLNANTVRSHDLDRLIRAKNKVQASSNSVTIWMIGRGLFNKRIQVEARRQNIVLIDDSNIAKFT